MLLVKPWHIMMQHMCCRVMNRSVRGDFLEVLLLAALFWSDQFERQKFEEIFFSAIQ